MPSVGGLWHIVTASAKMHLDMAQVHAAIGLIVDAGRILVSRRCHGDRFEHCWEFPGGKVANNEEPAQCLHREVKEELDVEVSIVAALPEIYHDYADFQVRLHPFILKLESGTPRPLASRELRWITVDQIATLPFPEANAVLIRDLPQILGKLHLV